MTHVLLVGDGAREHAIAQALASDPASPRVSVLAAHRNPGLVRVAEATGGVFVRGRPTSPADVLAAAEKLSPDLIVVGPEEPLFSNVAGVLREKGFTVFGPSARLARVEKDKVHARRLMWLYNIPGRLRFAAARTPGEAGEYARAMGDVAVKPARQAGGRGVRVFAASLEHLAASTVEAAGGYAEKLARQVAEKYGNDVEFKVIVEERVEGVEYTLMAVTDGETVVGLPLAEDHPHLHPYDTGPETGGMGAIAGPSITLPFITMEEYRETLSILEKTVKALEREEGERYRGVLSGQMMLTGFWGPTLIEYYVRFGDPEIAAVIPLLESSLLELLDRAASGRLSGYKLRVRDGVYTVVKAVAPAGYPLDRGLAKGHPVRVDEDAVRRLGCTLFYGGVDVDAAGRLVTTGSRLAEILCSSEAGFEDAASRADKAAAEAVELLDGHPLVYRWDIGSRSLLQRRAREARRARISYTRRRERGLYRIYDWLPGRGLLVYDYTSPQDPLHGHSG